MPVVPSRPAPGEDWCLDDPALLDLLLPRLPDALRKDAEGRLDALGRDAPARLDALARLADRHRPVLRTRTAEGEDAWDVEFHPSYEELRRAAREHEVFTLAWRDAPTGGRYPRALAFALGYVYAQAECGYYCPACMTDGAAFVLARHADPALAAGLVPRLVQREADGAFEGAMYLTEKGGGSDVGGGTATRAEPAEDGTWRLTGEKWFASNCTADVALALARMTPAEGETALGGAASGTEGLGLFVLPRRLDDGRPNPGLRVVRLKEKLGVASMPTGEVVLDGAVAHLVRPAPDGFKAMAEMVNLSRLYNAVASVALARRALREGLRAAHHREAFGRPLAEHPLFARSLVSVAVDVEAALAACLDAADAFDRAAAGDRPSALVLRVATPAAKAATARLAVRAASEACEWLGGVGYCEDYVTPRLLRDAQVLPMWEGTTNVQALELAKALGKDAPRDAFVAHVRRLLDEAGAAAAPEASAALEAFAAEAEAGFPEVAAFRALKRAYALHAHAALAAGAARGGSHRLARMAALHGAVRLGAGERAVEDAVARGEAAALLGP